MIDKDATSGDDEMIGVNEADQRELPQEGKSSFECALSGKASSTPIHSASMSPQPARTSVAPVDQLGRENESEPIDRFSGKLMSLPKGDSQDVHRDRLVAFYKAHNPEKLKDVEKLLMKFRGKEEAMFRRIETVYKLDVSAAADNNSDCVVKAAAVAPSAEEISTLQGIEEKMSDEELLQDVDSNMDDEQRESLRRRLVAFYKRHNVSKVDSVGKIKADC